MSNENKDRAKENTAAVVEAVSKTELFFSSNKVAIISVIAVLIIAGAGFFLWHKYGYMPQKAEAQEQMYPAEANFRISMQESANSSSATTAKPSATSRHTGARTRYFSPALQHA